MCPKTLTQGLKPVPGVEGHHCSLSTPTHGHLAQDPVAPTEVVKAVRVMGGQSYAEGFRMGQQAGTRKGASLDEPCHCTVPANLDRGISRVEMRGYWIQSFCFSR